MAEGGGSMPDVKGGEFIAGGLIRQGVRYVFVICGRERPRYAVRDMSEERLVIFNL